MKKVLLIENNPDYKIGGTETYNRNLAKIIHSNFSNVVVDRVSIYKTIKRNSDEFPLDHYFSIEPLWLNSSHSVNFNAVESAINYVKFRRLVYKLNSLQNYDLIIDSTNTTFKKFVNNENYFWIQHNTPAAYSHDIFPPFKKFFITMCQSVFGLKNNLYFAKNIIFFDADNYEYVKQRRKNSFNYYLICPSQESKQINPTYIWNNLKNRKKIVYYGRIENKQKNILLLLEINKKIKLIDFYGPGDDEFILKLGNSYKGFISSSQNKFDILNNYKYMILMSNHEGFPFSLAESLSFGLPIIVRDTFISAKSLTDKGENGFLLADSLNPQEYSEKINEIYNLNADEYTKLCKNSYNYANKYLSFNIFEEK